MNEILLALQTLRLSAVPEEKEIHDAIAQALSKANIAYVHEARIAPHKRLDFLCGSIGIEVKKGKPDRSALLEQCRRYLNEEVLDALIVVSQRPCTLPKEMLGKKLIMFPIDRLWGISLP